MTLSEDLTRIGALVHYEKPTNNKKSGDLPQHKCTVGAIALSIYLPVNQQHC